MTATTSAEDRKRPGFLFRFFQRTCLVRSIGSNGSLALAVFVTVTYLSSTFSFLQRMRTVIGGEVVVATYCCLVVMMLIGTATFFLACTSKTGILGLLYAFFMLFFLGYALGNHSTAKLLLIVILIVEFAFGFPSPVNHLAAFALAALAALVQLIPWLLGENEILPFAEGRDTDYDAAFVFVLFASAMAAVILDRMFIARRVLMEQGEQQERSIRQLEAFTVKLQSYAEVVDEESAKRERMLITREIHDISGYVFTNLIVMMDATISTGLRDPIAVEQQLIAARKQAQEGLAETRTVLRRLRLPESAERSLGGKNEIYKIVNVFRKITGVRVDLNFGNFTLELDQERTQVLRRIVQEALTNAIRHGKAKMITIHFWIRDGVLQLDILDDGMGVSHIQPGLGLSGMRERLQALSGEVSTESVSGSGFHLKVRLPL